MQLTKKSNPNIVVQCAAFLGGWLCIVLGIVNPIEVTFHQMAPLLMVSLIFWGTICEVVGATMYNSLAFVFILFHLFVCGHYTYIHKDMNEVTKATLFVAGGLFTLTLPT